MTFFLVINIVKSFLKVNKCKIYMRFWIVFYQILGEGYQFENI